jgi:DNA-binding NtrC family response regulator
VVKKHQGDIEVESTPGKGTTFTAWLPAADDGATVSAAMGTNRADPMVPRGSARVLLMDDDEDILRIGGIMLGHMGLEATLASDGAQALRQFVEARDAGRPFDLIILDLTIRGGLGGKATIEQIRKMDPVVPAIVSSGYSNDPVLSDFKKFGFQAMVSKPYEVTQMAKTIRELLALRNSKPPSDREGRT